MNHPDPIFSPGAGSCHRSRVWADFRPRGRLDSNTPIPHHRVMANELAKLPPSYLREVESLENEIAASNYATKLRREEEAQLEILREQDAKEQKQRRTEVIATNVLQCVGSIGGGVLSTLKWGKVPIGAILNGVLGSVGTVVAIQDPKHPAVRVAAHTVQTLLQNQIAITTRDIIRGMP
jgi:hypothetical protein